VATPFVPIVWWSVFHLNPMRLPQAHRRIPPDTFNGSSPYVGFRIETPDSTATVG